MSKGLDGCDLRSDHFEMVNARNVELNDCSEMGAIEKSSTPVLPGIKVIVISHAFSYFELPLAAVGPCQFKTVPFLSIQIHSVAVLKCLCIQIGFLIYL